MATHSSILAWKTPQMEEPGGLQEITLQSQTRLSDFAFTFQLSRADTVFRSISSSCDGGQPGLGLEGTMDVDCGHQRRGWKRSPAGCEGAAEAAPLRVSQSPSPTSPLTRSWQGLPLHTPRACLVHTREKGPPLCRREEQRVPAVAQADRGADSLPPGPPPATPRHRATAVTLGGGAEGFTAGGGPGPSFAGTLLPSERARDKGEAPQGTFKDLYFTLHKRTICQNNGSPWGSVLGAACGILAPDRGSNPGSRP